MSRLRTLARKLRGLRHLIRAGLRTDHPFLAHVVAVRRCNIACAYCNEYDRSSHPVALGEMVRRLDKLAELGTAGVAFSGGEPLLHPQLEDMIHRIRQHGMLAGLITNGYLLSRARIRSLNDAGLDFCQISIDNVEPDAVSKKSLRLLDRKLEWLARDAEFDVNINSVLGSGVRNPEDARVIAARARALGFSTSLGIVHGSDGRLRALDDRSRRVFDDVMASSRRWDQYFQNLYSGLSRFQRNLVDGQPNPWSCRAGGRYLYICEDGLVHWCSQQRGTPGIPLTRYTVSDINREFMTPKSCAPYCTVGCVHRLSVLDNWRKPQTSPIPAGTGLKTA